MKKTFEQTSEEVVVRTRFKHFTRVFLKRRVVVFGLVVIALLIITAVFAPFLAPYNPYKQDLRNVLASPSTEHLLGTDTLGRDILSRIIFGSRSSLLVGVVAIFVASTIGMLLGLTAGYFGGLIKSTDIETYRSDKMSFLTKDKRVKKLCCLFPNRQID